MIVVYPLTVQHDYTELRYSLRSLEKYLPRCEVVIVGSHVPEWINNVTHIEVPDVKGRKQLSIKKKLSPRYIMQMKYYFLMMIFIYYKMWMNLNTITTVNY